MKVEVKLGGGFPFLRMCTETQCQQAQEELEDAISGVMRAEQQLRENAREVRSELQSCVSRQQEALRCREVWLLGQIELLEQVKTETLQQQLHQLHRLRGQFDVIVQQLQNNNSNDLNNQLTACMEKLSSLNLTPEETPDMSFNADTRSLRQAITSFGRITAQVSEGVAPSSSAHQGASVQSCPMGAKKQKTEGGALSDWLLESHQAHRGAASGYQPSKNPQDWLLSHKQSQTSCPALNTVDFLQAWGQLRDLEAWLLQDHAPADRRRADSSCSSSFSIEKIDESEVCSSPGAEEEEEEEDDEEEEMMSDWLITPPAVAMETDAERWQRVLKPFEGGWSSGEWLLGSSPAADCTSCCQTSRPLEIENLGQLKCLKSPPPSGPASPAAASSAASALEAWLQRTAPAPQTCRANELCASYGDCVCEDNCGRRALSRWLLQHDGRDKNGVPVAKNAATPTDPNAAPPTDKKAPPTLFHREQQQKVQAILEAWLHPGTSSCRASSPLSAWVAPGEEKASREERSSASTATPSPFQRPLDPNMWVHPEKRPAPAEEEEEQEEDKWLLKKRSQAQERLALPTMCDLFSCMKVGGDKERWLHRTPVQM